MSGEFGDDWSMFIEQRRESRTVGYKERSDIRVCFKSTGFKIGEKLLRIDGIESTERGQCWRRYGVVQRSKYTYSQLCHTSPPRTTVRVESGGMQGRVIGLWT